MARTSPAGFFRDIPKTIAEKGRVKGFEALRDKVLTDWETLSGFCNAYSLLKLAIESDRHAMFAAVAEEKARGAFDREIWERYQDYLHGNVDVLPDQGDYRAKEDSASGSVYDGAVPFDASEFMDEEEAEAEEEEGEAYVETR
jgi:hypothetical protein